MTPSRRSLVAAMCVAAAVILWVPVALGQGQAAPRVGSGNGVITPPEQCDEGNHAGGASCNLTPALGPASLVKDINTLQSGFPSPLTAFDGKVFFSVGDRHARPGLWGSDGTPEGTVRMQPGSFSCPTATDRSLFCVVRSDTGLELWSIDSTETAVRVEAIAPSSGFSELAAIGASLFLGVVGGDGTLELWKSDGTAAGTMRLASFGSSPLASVPGGFTEAGGLVFFTFSESGAAAELWRTDGTPRGTARVRSFSFVGERIDVNGTLFFVADDGKTQRQIWKSDGTPAGTVRVSDFPPACCAQQPRGLIALNGALLFNADNYDHYVGRDVTGGLWRSDGTTAGTQLLVAGLFVGARVDVGGTLYFTAEDARADAGGHNSELWRTDGTTTGTVRVKDTHPGSYSSEMIDVDGTVYFTTDDGRAGVELWRSDGSESGTVLVADINPGAAGSNPAYLTAVDGTLYFWAKDGSYRWELWKSDGTEAGTARVADLLQDTSGSNPTLLTDVNGTLFFVADNGRTGAELWRSDGTDAGTRLVGDINPGGGAFHFELTPSRPTAVGDTLFFAADDGSSGPELWRSDGSENGTLLVKDINPSPAGSNPFDLTEAGGTLFFWADDGSHGFELWKSDGTAAGTSLVRDINPGSFPSVWAAGFSFCTPQASGAAFGGGALVLIGDPEGGGGPAPPCGAAPTDVNGTLFFRADDGSTGFELWKTDGTAEGTMRVADIVQGGAGSDPAQLTKVGGALFFTAAGALWRSDGTEAGTMRIANVATSNLTDVDGTLFFVSAGATPGLWRSDGTAAGTVRVRALGPDLTTISRLTNFAGTLVFTGSDASGVTQLWRSDGSAAGTVVLKSLPPSFLPASPLNDVGGLLVFATAEGEIWVSDGTAAGTRPVQHIDFGSQPSRSFAFTRAGRHVFFAADEANLTGTELWALPIATSCRGDCSSDGVVTVSDVITAVNIALDNAPLDACESLDANTDGGVTIDEIIGAVDEALNGCQ